MAIDRHQGRMTPVALLRRTAQCMVAELVDRLDAAGYKVSGAHHPVFENIDPEGTRLTVLASRADMTHQSMGELVRALEEQGYVERRADPSDGRARLVCLTSKGRRMVATAIREMGRIEQQWVAYLKETGGETDELAALEVALRRLEESSPALRSAA